MTRRDVGTFRGTFDSKDWESQTNRDNKAASPQPRVETIREPAPKPAAPRFGPICSVCREVADHMFGIAQLGGGEMLVCRACYRGQPAEGLTEPNQPSK